MGIIVFFVILFVYGLAGLILYLIYIPIRRKLLQKGYLSDLTNKIINKTFIIIIIIIALYSTITAFYPLNRFYKSEFEVNTGINFPKTGRIIKKDSCYPDFHGDYWAAAIFDVSQNDYESILAQVIKNNDFIIDTTIQGIGITTNFYDMTKDIDDTRIVVTFKHKTEQWFKVAFLDDKKTILFERSST